MTITYRSSASFASPSGGLNSVTLPKPAGTVTGDVLVAIIQVDQSNTITNASGWTTLDTWNASTGSTLRTVYKVAGASEPSSYSFSLGSFSDTSSGSIACFIGVNNSTPIRDHDTASASYDDSVSSPILSGTQSTDMVVVLGGARPENSHYNNRISAPNSFFSWTAPSSAKSGASSSGFGYPGSSALAYQISGSTGTFTTNYLSGIGTAAVSLIAATGGTSKINLSASSTSLSSLGDADLIGGGAVILPTTAEYEFFVDWNRDNGLRVSDFETDFDGWEPTTLLSFSTAQSYSGEQSLLATWSTGGLGANGPNAFTFDNAGKGFDTGTFGATGSDPADNPVTSITYVFDGLTIGDHYNYSGWFFVPNSGGQHVYISVDSLGQTSPTNVTGQWQELSLDFVASATTHTLYINASGTVTTGNKTYIDYIFVVGEFEDITTQVRTTSEVGWSYGRDQSRALNPISPAETSLVLDNRDGRYSPNNAASPVIRYLNPNREVLIRAKYNGKIYDLFRGFLDDIDVDPSIENQSATISCVDPLSIIGGTQLSTAIYEGLRTGEAIHKVLDEIGWPAERRDIDAGATLIQYWWAEGKDATDAINDLVASEGPPAYASVSDAGYFVFRDRHHRLVRSRSNSLQTTFSASGGDNGETEPAFSEPATINVGWKDIINAVTLAVSTYSTATFDVGDDSGSSDDGTEGDTNTDVHGATGEAPVVWSTTSPISINGGESATFTITSDDPFVGLQVPNADVGDYLVQGGSVNFSLDRTSGQSATLTVNAPDDNVVFLTGLAVRGYPLSAQEGVTVTVTDDTSIAEVGLKADTDNIEAPWANANDALAIGQIITNMRGERLPTMSITVNNGTGQRLNQIFNRKISDLIHIVEPRSYTDHDFYIESIEHSIASQGLYHTVTYGCEAVPDLTNTVVTQASPFTFDDAQAGFDAGVFAYDSPQVPADQVFILDQSLLDNDGLGY